MVPARALLAGAALRVARTDGCRNGSVTTASALRRKRVKGRAGGSDSLFGAPKAAEKKSLGDLFGSADTSTGALPEPTGAERCQL